MTEETGGGLELFAAVRALVHSPSVGGVLAPDVPVERSRPSGLVAADITDELHLPLAPGDPGGGLLFGQALVAELALISAVFIPERLETSLADKRPVLGVSYLVLLQMSRGEELLVTEGTHVARSVHSHVRLSVENSRQTFPADLAVEAP